MGAEAGGDGFGTGFSGSCRAIGRRAVAVEARGQADVEARLAIDHALMDG